MVITRYFLRWDEVEQRRGRSQRETVGPNGASMSSVLVRDVGKPRTRVEIIGGKVKCE